MAVGIVAEAALGAPCDRAIITVTGLSVAGDIVSIWRAADGERISVRGARRIQISDSAFIVDWDAPLGRPITYELEVISGPSGASRTISAPIVIASATGWLLDPLDPNSALPVIGGDGAGPYLRSTAFSDIEYGAAVQTFQIMGSSKPMALFGQRQAARGLDTSLGAESTGDNGKLADLLQSTASLLFKPLPEWGDYGLPGTLFLANASAKQVPVDVAWGGQKTWWNLSSDIVSAPTIKPLTGSITFGDVALLYATFQAKHDSVVAAASAAGEQPTFLFDLMNPLG